MLIRIRHHFFFWKHIIGAGTAPNKNEILGGWRGIKNSILGRYLSLKLVFCPFSPIIHSSIVYKWFMVPLKNIWKYCRYWNFFKRGIQFVSARYRNMIRLPKELWWQELYTYENHLIQRGLSWGKEDQCHLSEKNYRIVHS